MCVAILEKRTEGANVDRQANLSRQYLSQNGLSQNGLSQIEHEKTKLLPGLFRVHRENYKTLFQPHPMTIRSSLHNPVVKAFPETICLQRCFPSVGWSSALPSSPDVPFHSRAGPTFRGQGCNIRGKFPYCLYACDKPRSQPSVIRKHWPAGRPRTMRISR